jgi:predicted nucleic acid-binding protein
MILVDSSVWIDFFHGTDSRETEFLDKALGETPVAIGDLILTEVLQGFRSGAEMLRARRSLLELFVVEIAGKKRALLAAENYRTLRDNGITVPKTIDTLIATFCIEQRMPLLFTDRDFDPFVEHLGLVPALP